MRKTKEIKVKNLVLGRGAPKICVSLMGKDVSEFLQSASAALNSGADIYELRADFLHEAAEEKTVIQALKEVRCLLRDSPLIFTMRNEEEGGELTLPDEVYARVNLAVIESGLADIIDVEISRGDESVEHLSVRAHEKGQLVLLSNHIFEGTPSQEKIISILREMQQLPADMIKLAVMARSDEDVLALLNATLVMREEWADRPFITIAMGEKGILSRIAGGIFGSSLTFAKAGDASAPGQLEVSEVRTVLDLLHSPR